MALGLELAPTRIISARSMLSRLRASMRTHTLSTQYKLLAIQSTAISSRQF